MRAPANQHTWQWRVTWSLALFWEVLQLVQAHVCDRMMYRMWISIFDPSGKPMDARFHVSSPRLYVLSENINFTSSTRHRSKLARSLLRYHNHNEPSTWLPSSTMPCCYRKNDALCRKCFAFSEWPCDHSCWVQVYAGGLLFTLLAYFGVVTVCS